MYRLNRQEMDTRGAVSAFALPCFIKVLYHGCSKVFVRPCEHLSSPCWHLVTALFSFSLRSSWFLVWPGISSGSLHSFLLCYEAVGLPKPALFTGFAWAGEEGSASMLLVGLEVQAPTWSPATLQGRRPPTSRRGFLTLALPLAFFYTLLRGVGTLCWHDEGRSLGSSLSLAWCGWGWDHSLFRSAWPEQDVYCL